MRTCPTTANRLLHDNDLKYLTVSVKVGNGMRFSLGYVFGPNEATRYDNKLIAAGIDRKLNENYELKNPVLRNQLYINLTE